MTMYLCCRRADFIYMASLFLVCYAAGANNTSLLRESIEQCRHCREPLQVSAGLWQHVQGLQHTNVGAWSIGIGNAWPAAAGITHVLTTVLKAPMHITSARRRQWG